MRSKRDDISGIRGERHSTPGRISLLEGGVSAETCVSQATPAPAQEQGRAQCGDADIYCIGLELRSEGVTGRKASKASFHCNRQTGHLQACWGPPGRHCNPPWTRCPLLCIEKLSTPDSPLIKVLVPWHQIGIIWELLNFSDFSVHTLDLLY